MKTSDGVPLFNFYPYGETIPHLIGKASAYAPVRFPTGNEVHYGRVHIDVATMTIRGNMFAACNGRTSHRLRLVIQPVTCEKCLSIVTAR